MTKSKNKTPKQACKLLHIGYDKLQTAIRGGLAVDDEGKVDVEEAREWLQQKESAKLKGIDLLNKKKEAEISKLEAAEELQQLELKKARGEVHSVKECAASLGPLLSTIWYEIQALPSRLQSAFPDNPHIQGVSTEMINESSDLIQHYLKKHGAKLSDAPPT